MLHFEQSWPFHTMNPFSRQERRAKKPRRAHPIDDKLVPWPFWVRLLSGHIKPQIMFNSNSEIVI
jgi:hypothetical protein